LSVPGPAATPRQGGFLRLAATAIAIYFVAWICWTAAVYYGFGWFTEWAHIPLDGGWQSDPRRFQRLLALPPLLPVLIWTVMALGARRQRDAP
jgi:hypothetical protein